MDLSIYPISLYLNLIHVLFWQFFISSQQRICWKWSPSGREQSAMLQISWQSPVSSAQQAILTWYVPCLSPDHMLAETKHQNKTLIAAGDCHRLKACSCCTAVIPSPLTALHVFMFSACYVSLRYSKVTDSSDGERFLFWCKQSVCRQLFRGKCGEQRRHLDISMRAVCWHNVFPASRLC